MKDFRDLQVWRKAHELTLKIYGETKTFPKEEVYDLTSQMRRSASSIPTNIAEVAVRARIRISVDSYRLRSGRRANSNIQLLLCRDLNLFASGHYSELEEKVIEVKKMLASLIARTRQQN